MILRTFILFLTFLIINIGCFAQENQTLGRAVYIEIGGKGFISGNVDLPLSSNSRLTLGLTILDHEFNKEETEENYPTLTLPTPSVMYLHLSGKERHYFETGFGLSISPLPWKDYSPNDSMLSLHGSLGYRYQVPNRFFFRGGFTPFYRIKWMALPLVGLSFGYSW